MKFTDKCSILAGAAGSGDMALIAVMNDALAEQRQQHAIPLLHRHGGWVPAGQERVLPWLAAGIARTRRRSTEFAIVGWAGQVLVVDGQESRREAIQRKDDYVSLVRSVATIDDAVYAAGMRRQVHKRTGGDGWQEVDHGVAYRGDEAAIGFNAVDGFNGEELYAVGLNGEIWHRGGSEWRQVHAPTNVHLHSVCCAPDGRVYVGGRSGLLMGGRNDSWEVVDLETDETVWDLHWLGDQLYLLFGGGIHRGTPGKIRKIEDDAVGEGDFHRLSSAEGRLWAFGRKKVVQFDGSLWREVDHELSDDLEDSEVLGFFNDDVLSTGSAYLQEDE